jgi:bifunctional UDP-N-acetylglucosamine pyrophosphorylase/glucosamine-1-phosphate N-acetyltransferase
VKDSSSASPRALHVVILAAGEGTRMKLPGKSKVLLKVGSETIVEKVVSIALSLYPASIQVIVGFRAEDVMAALSGRPVNFVFQLQQWGTGHAVLQAETLLKKKDGDVLILLGDVPLIQGRTLETLIEEHRGRGAAATVLSMEPENPDGYGRILRDGEGTLIGIVEHRDATPEQLAIRESNSGIFCFDLPSLFPALRKTTRDNVQNQYYLTDTVHILRREGKTVHCVKTDAPEEVMGINNREDLARVQKVYAACAESSDT